MKKIFLLSIALSIVAVGYAQNPKQPQKSKELTEQIADINKQIANINKLKEDLKKDIDTEYEKYKTPDNIIYTDKKQQENAFAELDKEKDSLRIRITELNHDIDSLKEGYKAVDKIREYYERDSIDALFVHADLMTLHIHKEILAKDCPKVMDDLQTLLECADLLTKGYEQDKNSSGRKKLEDVRQCDTKDNLDALLCAQKDITDEVESWIKKDEEHTLYSMAVFLNNLYINYGVSLDVEFPYLYGKVVETVELPSTKK